MENCYGLAVELDYTFNAEDDVLSPEIYARHLCNLFRIALGRSWPC